ncbi:MAG TPA: hypothetical protein VGI64_15660 [Streptosporangiaceae bacterium]|jgi:hypothetical protein
MIGSVRPRRALLAAAAVTAALAAAACGSGTARPATRQPPAAAPVTMMTSRAGQGGAAWAVVEMGGPAASHDNFWQLFTRGSAGGGWRLATPKGVADNGGLTVAQQAPGQLITGFVPSQFLTFSPLARSADNGASWSPGLINGGLAALPGALAAAPDGRLLAILRGGTVQLSAPGGTGWAKLTATAELAATPAGRACGLTQLTGAAFSPSGQPVLAGQCSRPGIAGIFTLSGGSWRAVATSPSGASALPQAGLVVAGLARLSAGDAAVLTAVTAAGPTLIPAWSAGQGRPWTLGAPLRLGSGELRSVSFSDDGGLAVVSGAAAGAILGGPGGSWQSLPALPAGSVTLVPGSHPQVLARSRTVLSAWQLSAGGWRRMQQVKVPIPFGSSG